MNQIELTEKEKAIECVKALSRSIEFRNWS